MVLLFSIGAAKRPPDLERADRSVYCACLS